MRRRILAGSDISLSQVSFGSMRFSPDRLSKKDGVILLSEVLANGITTFHSSKEYEHYDYFCELLKETIKNNPSASIEHIVKIPAPHFKDEYFCKSKFRNLIEEQLIELGTDRLDVVQWLVRHEPNTDFHRLQLLKDSYDDINEVWQELKEEGKVGVLSSFPYSEAFANEVLSMGICSGLTDYLNLMEVDRVKFFDYLQSNDKHFIAIRPLMAGTIRTLSLEKQHRIIKCSNADSIETAALMFPLLHPNVTSEIISISQIKHLEHTMSIVENLHSNKELFYELYRLVLEDEKCIHQL